MGTQNNQNGAEKEAKVSQSEPRNHQKHHRRNRVEQMTKNVLTGATFGSHFFFLQNI